MEQAKERERIIKDIETNRREAKVQKERKKALKLEQEKNLESEYTYA